ncbi:MAG TPA: SGNH/GDSL hydrolase family protein [Chryseosolibacter sp.]
MKLKNLYGSLLICIAVAFCCAQVSAQVAGEEYLRDIRKELTKEWPANRTINLVFHGHSVPSGYFKTPEVRTLDAYPHQVLEELKAIYPTAVINMIVTSIGGENSQQGEKRFSKDVLVHHPDVLFIDYALNDRRIGPDKARAATEKMIRKALKRKIRVILLTPSPDLQVDIRTPGNELELFARQIRDLAARYRLGLADSYEGFRKLAAEGVDITGYMAQSNHPNRKGHSIIAAEIVKYFK